MKELRARDVMSRKVVTVSPDLTLIDLERELSAQRISGAPVVERGSVVGIVSRSDIDRFVSRERMASAATATYYLHADLPEGEETAQANPTKAALEGLQKTLVREIMTAEVISVAPSDRIGDVARLMHGRRIHRVLVVEGDELAGLISSLDMVGVLASASS